MAFFQTIKRKFSVYSWGTRVPTRVAYSAGGQTVSINRVFGFDGIPVGAEGRGKTQDKEARSTGSRRRGITMFHFIVAHWICAIYVVVAFVLGVLLQGWV